MKNVIKNQNKARNRAGNFNALKLVLSDPKRPEEAAHQDTQPV